MLFSCHSPKGMCHQENRNWFIDFPQCTLTRQNVTTMSNCSQAPLYWNTFYFNPNNYSKRMLSNTNWRCFFAFYKLIKMWHWYVIIRWYHCDKLHNLFATSWGSDEWRSIDRVAHWKINFLRSPALWWIITIITCLQLAPIWTDFISFRAGHF